MTASVTIGERCKHQTRRPVKSKAGFLTLRCSTCGKAKQVKGHHCTICGPLWDAYQKAVRENSARWKLAETQEEREAMLAQAPDAFKPGCSGCFEGLTTPDWVPPCCCYVRRRRCDGCESVASRELPHVCTVETAEEIDFELALAFAPTPTTLENQAERAAERGLYEEAQGFRAPK